MSAATRSRQDAGGSRPRPARTRPAPGGGATRDRGAGRSALLAVAVALAVLAVMAGAVWSVTNGLGTAAAPGPDQLAVPGGLVEVDEVVEAEQAMAGMAMPGMGTDNDPVAEGEKRVSVDVTVLATGRGSVDVDPEEFTLEADGEGARAPHRSFLPAATVPEGSQLSGTLVFDVPAGATTGTLGHVEGGALVVDLPDATPQPHESADHEGHDVDGGAGSSAEAEPTG